jgi:hypothetical protein
MDPSQSTEGAPGDALKARWLLMEKAFAAKKEAYFSIPVTCLESFVPLNY